LRNGEATSDDLLSLLLESNMEHCRGGGGDSGAGGSITTADDVNRECVIALLKHVCKHQHDDTAPSRPEDTERGRIARS
jgi:hypothetical protein